MSGSISLIYLRIFTKSGLSPALTKAFATILTKPQAKSLKVEALPSDGNWSLILLATSVILVNEPMALYRQDISGNPKWKIYTGLSISFAST